MNDDVGILLVRVITGAFFAAHGSQMLFGWFGGRGIRAVSTNFHNRGFRPALPYALAAASTELFGGLGVALGILWPVPPVALIGPMLVAVVIVHWPKIWVTENGVEYPLVLAFVMAGIGMMHPGKYSIDNALDASLPHTPAYIVVLAGAVAIALSAAVSSKRVKRREHEAAPAPGVAAGSGD